MELHATNIVLLGKRRTSDYNHLLLFIFFKLEKT